jgi:hypothetical protein
VAAAGGKTKSGSAKFVPTGARTVDVSPLVMSETLPQTIDWADLMEGEGDALANIEVCALARMLVYACALQAKQEIVTAKLSLPTRQEDVTLVCGGGGALTAVTPAVIDSSTVPMEGPFTLQLNNLPFQITQQYLIQCLAVNSICVEVCRWPPALTKILSRHL